MMIKKHRMVNDVFTGDGPFIYIYPPPIYIYPPCEPALHDTVRAYSMCS